MFMGLSGIVDGVSETAYGALEQLFARVRVLEDATGILNWDAQTKMPIGAAAGRAEQLATLRGLAHETLVCTQTTDLLEAAEADHASLDLWQSANLREMRRTYVHAAAAPKDVVIASSQANSQAEMVWREAKRTSDFHLLLPYLKAVLNLQRETGQAKGDALGISTYDALLDRFDSGLRQSRIEERFSSQG